MKTFQAKPSDITRKWYVLDASEVPLGRLATQAATLLTGKGKPSFTKHIDCGDYVVVINSSKLVVTGDKMNSKLYYRHSGFPGGLTTRSLSQIMEKNPSEVIFKAIRGMLPVNKLRDERLKRLKIYNDEQHNHAAQTPEPLSLRKKGNV